MEWFSVDEKLPSGEGVSFGSVMSKPVLVKHKERPDYPIVCHCVKNNTLKNPGIAIPVNFDGEYKSVEWYSALRFPVENPFGLGEDNKNVLPLVLGLGITHWAYIE